LEQAYWKAVAADVEDWLFADPYLQFVELVEAVEKGLNVAIIYCSGHNVGDNFELMGKEFNDSNRCFSLE